MSSNTLHISIVIPAHNEEKYIATTIRSLQEQEYAGEYEIIVVDNSSTDNTAAVATAAGARVVSESRKGVCFARQKGTEVATGKIIISTDADSTFPHTWLASIAEQFEKEEGVVAVTGPFQFTAPPRWSVWYSKTLFRFVWLIFNLRGTVAYAAACNFAFKKETWHAIGEYNTKLTQGGDEYDLLRRLRKKGEVVFVKDNVVQTSSRRLKHGLLYNAFVTIGIYYFLEYLIARVTGKSLIGSYPAYREEHVARHNVWLKSAGVLVALFLVWRACSSVFGYVHIIGYEHVPKTLLHKLHLYT